MTTPETNQGAATLAAFMAGHLRKPELVPISAGSPNTADVVALPAGYTLHDVKPLLDKYLGAPERREGTTTLTTLASFAQWVNRHRDDGTVIFAADDMKAPSLTAIIDHDAEGPELVKRGEEEPAHRARFGRHRGVFTFPFSRPWQEWMEIAGPDAGGIKTHELAAFLERRISDVLPPPLYQDGQTGETHLNVQDPEILKLVATLGKKLATPSELVTLSKGISVNVDNEVEAKYDADTGEASMVFRERNGMGAEKVKVPNLFLIAIPVLNAGDPWIIPVHLRYRTGQALTWYLELHQPERVFEKVFDETIAKVTEDTTIQPLRGIAPAAR